MDKNDEFEDNNEKYEDDFGLPDVNYKPLQDDNEESRNDDEKYTFSDEDEDESRNPLIVGIVIGVVVLLLGGGALFYNFIYKPNAEKEKEEQLLIKNQNKQRREKAKLARLKKEKEAAMQQAIADSIAQAEKNVLEQKNRVSIGSIRTLNGPTGNYHVIISSGIDDDLLSDYAKRLRRKGVSTKIIAPYGKTKFHRLAISNEYQTRSLAEAKAGEVGSTYRGQAWVLKY